MARKTVDTLMTGEEIARTFGDATVVNLQERQEQIIQELRLWRLNIVDIDDEDRAAIHSFIEELMRESRENSDTIREIRKARTESIGMKVR